jgi:hypothetical protein
MSNPFGNNDDDFAEQERKITQEYEVKLQQLREEKLKREFEAKMKKIREDRQRQEQLNSQHQ